MGNIRNSLISFEAWHKKVKNAKISSISQNINILRCDYGRNADEIFRLEQGAQKGYNSDRYVQEVLINFSKTITQCKTANIQGSVLAIDMAKAFDTLNHDYICRKTRYPQTVNELPTKTMHASQFILHRDDTSAHTLASNPSPAMAFGSRLVCGKPKVFRLHCRDAWRTVVSNPNEVDAVRD
jgi:hypothetical protein